LLLMYVPTENGKMDSWNVGDFLAIPFTDRSFYLSSGADETFNYIASEMAIFFPSVLLCITDGLLDLAGSHMFSGAREKISLQFCDLFQWHACITGGSVLAHVWDDRVPVFSIVFSVLFWRTWRETCGIARLLLRSWAHGWEQKRGAGKPRPVERGVAGIDQ
jgi:hypothetical protein